MIELRDMIKRGTACTFNYVLLNLYKGGNDYISHHKDNESSLDPTFPIACLSFGAQRTIEFRRPNFPSTHIILEQSLLYTMEQPTNQLFSHGIAANPFIKGMRISLTFRHFVPAPVIFKKPKLNLELI